MHTAPKSRQAWPVLGTEFAVWWEVLRNSHNSLCNYQILCWDFFFSRRVEKSVFSVTAVTYFLYLFLFLILFTPTLNFLDEERGGVDCTTLDHLKPPIYEMLEFSFWILRVLQFSAAERHLDPNFPASEESAQAWLPLGYSPPPPVKQSWSSTLSYSLRGSHNSPA